ncbi:DMT family transporter [Streptomyces sp. A1547]|uniref:DMT family transporter n=1 Tax=Streptomyces sp. A1547 TaxID=2563105 RepID=UPI00109E8DE7|nr:DMT family transporter [Streptomyces sp. A1547]THA33281.1 DMT family transporter [Streptomyces sp. A1547]
MEKETSLRSESAQAYVYLLATMALFGSAFASSKSVVGHMPHQVAAVLRFGGGAVILVVLLAFIGRKSKGPSLTRSQIARAAAVGLVGVFAYNLFFFWGLSLAPSIDGSIIVPVLSPVITTGILLALGREKASGARMGGLALGVSGAVVFFVGAGGTGVDAGGSRLTGDLVYLLGALSWAVYSIASKKVLVGMDPLRATTFGTLAGALALLLFAVPAFPDVEWSALSSTTWLNVVYLAVGPTAMAYLFYYRGLRVVSPSTATVIMFSVPVFGVTCAVVFLGESFGGLQLAGAAVMLAGALLAVTQGRLRQQAPEQPAQETGREADPAAPAPLSGADGRESHRKAASTTVRTVEEN